MKTPSGDDSVGMWGTMAARTDICADKHHDEHRRGISLSTCLHWKRTQHSSIAHHLVVHQDDSVSAHIMCSRNAVRARHWLVTLGIVKGTAAVLQHHHSSE